MNQISIPLIIKTKLIGSKETTIFNSKIQLDYRLTQVSTLHQIFLTLHLYLITLEREA